MLKIGTSGFSFKDWVGTAYPERFNLKNALNYYQQVFDFDCVEINSTYYTLVSAKSFEGMEKKTGKGFQFIVKGYRGITHDPFDSRLGDKKPGIEKAAVDMDKFIYSVMPLKDKGKLAGVLLQFPIFFYPVSSGSDAKEQTSSTLSSPIGGTGILPVFARQAGSLFHQERKGEGENTNAREYLLLCREKFEDIPLIIEFRNNAWTTQDNFEFLKNNNLGYCAVDEPKLPGLVEFRPEVTSDTAYFRLHGRNRRWFNAQLSERYDYDYSEKELTDFIPHIRNMEKKAKVTFVMFNNCHAGSAVKNALLLKKLLTQYKDI